MAATLEFHPLANAYPLMSDAELEDLADGMRRNGFDPSFPITMYEGKILAGRDRYRAVVLAKSKRKQGDAKIEPVYRQLPKGEDPQEFVERENELRKHFSQDYMERKRHLRIERVARMRAEGKSTRVIAEEEGVSKSQVERDLKASGVPGGDTCPPNGTVTGKDGKEYSATKPEPTPTLFCRPCRTSGPKKGCEACKKLREKNGRGEPGQDESYQKKVAKAKKAGKPKAGAEVFNLRTAKDGIGIFVAEIDKLCHQHGLVNGQGKPSCVEHRGLVNKTGECVADLETWLKQLKKSPKS